MDFGKLPSVDKVDFSLPPEPAGNARVLSKAGKSEEAGCYIGPTGYNMKAWTGLWYPPGSKEKDFLHHYGAQFNTIEFNTTHYRMPDHASIERWSREVPDDFRFCPKIPQSISHSSDLGLTGPEPQIFCDAVNGFGEKLGCSFMQLPPHFSPQETPKLARFLEKYAVQTPLAIEVRHPAFYQDNPEAELYWQLLEQSGATAVITDVAGRRDVCHMRLSNVQTMVRFVGNGLHPSDYTRVREWAQRLKHWFAQGLDRVYFFTHEPDNLLAPELAAFCAETFAAALPGVPLRGPKPVGGRQGTLF